MVKSYIVHRTSYIVHRTSYIVHRTSYIVHPFTIFPDLLLLLRPARRTNGTVLPSGVSVFLQG